MGINVFTGLSAANDEEDDASDDIDDEEDDASEDIDWSDTIGLPEMVRFD